MKYIIPFFLCMFFWAGLPKECSGQVNLVDLKKKEEERRKNTEKSKKAVDDGNIANAGNTGKSSGFVQVKTTGTTTSTSGSDSTEKKDSRSSKSGLVNILDSNEESKWRTQKQEYDQRIKELEDAIANDESQLQKLWNDFYMQSDTSNQNRIKAQLSQLNTQMEGNKAKLSQTKSERDKFLKEAKDKGVPPGWLR